MSRAILHLLPALLLAAPAWAGETTAATAVRHAKGFRVEQAGAGRLVTVERPWRGATTGFRYLLLPREAPAPTDAGCALVVRVPVKTVALASITFVAAMEMLGELDRVTGVTDGRLVNSPEAARRITEGKIAEVGTGTGMEGRMDIERLYAMKPELIMAYGMGIPEFDTHPKLLAAGFPVVLSGEYMEATPLGRAEWLKFTALFVGKEIEAERLFSRIESDYEALRAKAAGVGRRPSVFTSIDFKGTWYVSGGGSYMARFLADAGSDYLWRDDTSVGSIPLGEEAVLVRALQAEFWLHPGQCATKADILALDRRYANFRAFKEDRIFHNSRVVNKAGGNDYWETGMLRPDLLLADLIAIFHPELLPGHIMRWHGKAD